MFYANKYKTIDEMIHGKDAADHDPSGSAMSQCDVDRDDSKAPDEQGAPGPPASVQAKRNAAILQRMRIQAMQMKSTNCTKDSYNHGIINHLVVFKTKL